MTLNLLISQLTADREAGQPVRTEMDTETTLIVKDGETVMLGGMLFQEDQTIERAIPLLSDIPLIGGLFKHTETQLGNTEMLVFITPYVIDEDPDAMLPETKSLIESEQKKFDSILSELQASIEEVD